VKESGWSFQAEDLETLFLESQHPRLLLSEEQRARAIWSWSYAGRRRIAFPSAQLPCIHPLNLTGIPAVTKELVELYLSFGFV
jgi:hypothetical protein